MPNLLEHRGQKQIQIIVGWSEIDCMQLDYCFTMTGYRVECILCCSGLGLLCARPSAGVPVHHWACIAYLPIPVLKFNVQIVRWCILFMVADPFIAWQGFAWSSVADFLHSSPALCWLKYSGRFASLWMRLFSRWGVTVGPYNKKKKSEFWGIAYALKSRKEMTAKFLKIYIQKLVRNLPLHHKQLLGFMRTWFCRETNQSMWSDNTHMLNHLQATAIGLLSIEINEQMYGLSFWRCNS